MKNDQIIPSQQSWWLDEALNAEGSISSAAPLIGKAEFDVAIVGEVLQDFGLRLLLKNAPPL